MKIILFSILIFLLVSVSSYSSERVVYLDVEKIMQNSNAGKSIITKLKFKRESSLSQFKKKEKDIIEKEKKLISQRNVLSKEEFEKKIKDLRDEITKFQKDRNKAFNEIAQLRVKASTNLLKKLNPILENYSKTNSISMVIQKKHIVIGKKEDDITKDILELVNQKVKDIKLD
tara:strand:- start:77 stop:595 length:519 start_codon:yes stop_codon:yes gene_type:complete